MEQKEVTLADILKCLNEQKAEIKDAKEETSSRLEKFMNAIENNISEVKRDVNVLNNIMEERERDTREHMQKIEDNFIETERRRKEDREDLQKRMRKLETALQETRLQNTPVRNTRKQSEKEKETEKQNKVHDISINNLQEERATVTSPETTKETVPEKEKETPKNWYKSVCDELKEAAAKADNINEKKEKRLEEKERKRMKKEKTGMKSIKRWFSQDSPDNSLISSESDTSDNENKEEKVERRERNKIRRKRNLENRKNLQTEIATKASRTIGCHPIREAEVEEINKNIGDLNKAREIAVKNFLKNYLQFNNEELKEVVILDTKTSMKGDNTIYTVFKDIDTIKELHWRIAEIRNPEVILRNYIPPGFWSRYMHLSSECKEYRNKNPNMKTQMRFGMSDVEILLKKKGTDETYKKVPFETITEPADIPQFDHNLKWTRKVERPRRKLIAYHEDSERMEVEAVNTRKTQRQRSKDPLINSKDKKQKISADSSDSEKQSEIDEEL